MGNSILVILLAFFLVSCSFFSRPEDLIIGRWAVPGSNSTIEYFKDGRVTIVDDGVPARGEYDFLTPDYVQIHFTNLGVNERFKVSVSKDKLLITKNGYSPVAYQRMPRTEPEPSETPAHVSRYKEVVAKAEAGDPYYQGVLAGWYRLGRGGANWSPGYEEATKWAKLSAEQGNPLGRYNLAVLMISRHIDMDKANDLLVESYNGGIKVLAEQGDAYAQCYIGEMYKRGWGFQSDNAKAFKWYHRAAKQGNEMAQYSLGYMYNMGEGVKCDYAEAAKWYKKAADQGDKPAMDKYDFCLQQIEFEKQLEKEEKVQAAVKAEKEAEFEEFISDGDFQGKPLEEIMEILGDPQTMERGKIKGSLIVKYDNYEIDSEDGKTVTSIRKTGIVEQEETVAEEGIKAEPPPWGHIAVTGILVGDEMIAVVNEKIVKEGDEVNGVRVIEIGKNAVTFKHNDTVFTRKLGD